MDVVQDRRTTRRESLPAGVSAVAVRVRVPASELNPPAKPLTVRAELWGVFGDQEFRLARGAFPGPALSAHWPEADSVFVVFEPSRPVSVGIELVY